jgi:hypothetical protein
VSSALATVRRRPSVPLLASPATAEHLVERRVTVAWGLLMLNVLTFVPGTSVLHIPSALGKIITQGALPVALLILLTVNRRLIFRPNVFLCLMSLLAIEAIVTALTGTSLGTVYRTFRLVEFIVALWLLTPFWGRRDMLLLRCHLKVLSIILGSVVLGLLVAPGRAMTYRRLNGVIWPIPPTQVAHYAAVTIGLVVILWLCGHRSGRVALAVVVVTSAVLILSHTRTALVGLLAGVLIAGLSLVTRRRVRRLLVGVGITGVVAGTLFSSPITRWLERGEGSTELRDLTGRTAAWEAVANISRDRFQEIFGFGLSNDSINGLAIDSNWLASYQDQGLFGVTLCAVVLLFLMLTSYIQSRGVYRALALFLIIYCLLASFTEVGFTSASPYLLDLTVAASLLLPSAGKDAST